MMMGLDNFLRLTYSLNFHFIKNKTFKLNSNSKRKYLFPTKFFYQFSTRASSQELNDKEVDEDGNSAKKKYSKRGSSFLDSLRIHVKGGTGGQGLPKRGGVGGKGGDVILVGGKEGYTLNKLVSKFPNKRFSGETGGDARLFCLIGESAKPTYVKVPLGITVLSEERHKMGEINAEKDEVLVAKGGLGGYNLNGFAGEKGEAQSITLDLKLIADVGFVGFPNAGKSTLLKAISRAKPRIAAYPFTTIRPNVGIIEYEDYRRISLADLPGLIEGAHENIGMGHNFLKHVLRTKLMLFVIDVHGFRLSPKYPFRSALETILLLNRELELYDPQLAEKPAILVLNKIDFEDGLKKSVEIQKIYESSERVKELISQMPLECRPQKIIKYDKILGISAAKDQSSVLKLKNTIRKVIDVNEELRQISIEKTF